MQSQLQDFHNTAADHHMVDAQAFNAAFAHLIDSEGKFQDDRADRGNWTSGRIGVGQLKGTKFGISAMTYPTLNIKDITIEDAKAINYVDWWLMMSCDEIHEDFAFQVYDAAYNHGRRRSAMWVQEVVGVAADGWIGPITLKAIEAYDPCKLVLGFNHLRLHFFTRLRTWKRYGKGWSRRVADNLIA